MQFVFAGLLSFVFLILGAWWSQESTHTLALQSLCSRVQSSYYRRDHADVALQLALCTRPLQFQSGWLSPTDVINQLNRRADEFQISHLQVHAPQQDRKIWLNEATETGLRARWIEDKLIVVEIVLGSSAERAGFRLGDEIVQVNGADINGPREAQHTGGRYLVRRLDVTSGELNESFIEVEPSPFRENLEPKLELLEKSSEVGILRLRSFLPQYFEKDRWLRVTSDLLRFRGLVVDLRGNLGGSFPAMLRALSPFRCGQVEIGELRRLSRYQIAGANAEGPMRLSDDLSDQAQHETLGRGMTTKLATFGQSYGCFTGPVVALIDGDTASVSEIFAAALSMRPLTRLVGQSTAGQMVMAQWFPLPALGSARVSVPIAGFWTESGFEIEGRGIYPDEILYDDLLASRQGRDTWIEWAALSLSTN